MSDAPVHPGMNVSYSVSRRFAWYRVAKTGTRSLNRLFEDTIPDYRYLLRADPIPADLQQLLDDGCLTFSFVRNPWDRLASGWRNKLSRDFPRRRNFINQLRTDSTSEDQLTNATTDFGVFLDLLPGSVLFERDIHFHPQARILGDTPIDVVGRFETYRRDVEHVLDALGLGSLCAALPHLNRSSEGEHYRSLYDDRTRTLAAELYGADITRWGYRFDDGPAPA